MLFYLLRYNKDVLSLKAALLVAWDKKGYSGLGIQVPKLLAGKV